MASDDEFCVIGFNFKRIVIAMSRSCAIVTRDKGIAEEVLKLFEVDSAHQSYTPALCNLVSAETAQDTLGKSIRGAQKGAPDLRYQYSRPRDNQAPEGPREQGGADWRVRQAQGGDRRRHWFSGPKAPGFIFSRSFGSAFGGQSLRTMELDKRHEIGVLFNNVAFMRQLMPVFESDWALPLDTERNEQKKEAVPT